MLLEDALEKYPIEITLWDGTKCIVRPLQKRDDVRLQKFFLSVPEEERLFVKQPITDRTMFRHWCRQPDFDRNLPLLMLHGKKVVGEATLHQRGAVGNGTSASSPCSPILSIVGGMWPKSWSPN